MSSKKSEKPQSTFADVGPVASINLPRHAPWIGVLRSNWWLPLILFLIPVGHYLEDPDKVSGYHTNILLQIGVTITAAVSLQLINGISGQFSLGHAGFMAVGAYAAGYAIQNFSTTPIITDDVSADRYVNPGGVLLFFIALFLAFAIVGITLSVTMYAIRRLRGRKIYLRGLGRTPFALDLSAYLGFLVIAWMSIDLIVYARSGLHAYSLWSRLVVGAGSLYDGMISHGTSTAGWITNHLPISWRQPMTMLVALIGGGILAGAAGWVVGLPTLRLRGDYLAIATLGFAEIIRIVITNAKPLGRATGLQIPPYSVQPDPGNDPPIVGHYIFPWIYGTAILTTVMIYRLKRSGKGRAIQAVREDEIAARAVGIDNVHHKVIAFVIGAFFAGVAGALFGTFQGYLNPNQFDFAHSVTLVVIVTLGGLGSIWGAVIAAMVLTVLPEIFKDPRQWLEFLLGPVLRTFHINELHLSPRTTRFAQWVAENQAPLFALALVALMLIRYGDFSFLKRRRRVHGKVPTAAMST